LVAYDDGRLDQAQNYLTQALEQPASRGIASYYLGAIAAQREDWPETIKFWQAAWDAGFRTVRLQENLGELYHRLAEQSMQEGDHETAVSYGGQAESRKPDDKALSELLAVGWQHYAQDTLADEDWESALDYWELAEEQGGGTFRLAYNMALALEKLEIYMEAAERWREALRRRPRRDDHPDAITDDQVARLWHRVALVYEKAGEYEEAIQVYKQAVKWKPDDYSVRMALAQRLLDMGRFQAAENELGRILEQNKDYIPALLLIGEVIAGGGSWNEELVTGYWQRVLELDPNNLNARDNLANYYLDLAERYFSWGYQTSLTAMYYEKALSYRPQDGYLWARAGRAYYLANDREKAQIYMDRAMELSPNDLRIYGDLIILYLAHKQADQAWPILDKAEETIAEIPSEFYISLAATCLLNQDKEPAQTLLNQAVKKAKPDEPIFLEIGQFLAMIKGAGDEARSYLGQAIAAGQEPGLAYMMLGIVAVKEDDEELAEKHWQKAEEIARETDNHELLPAIQQARMLYTGPFAFMARNLGLNDLNALESIMSGDLFDEDDEEYYDYYYDDDEEDVFDDDYFDDEDFLNSLFGEDAK
jgi:tetratricopeptide (TPR) repeat protein